MSNFSTSDILFKALDGQINIDSAQGIVECFVAAIGNKDSVGDVIVSGAFTESLKRRKPRVVWGHNWNDPIGKVLEIYEVPANDPRIPTKMRMAGVGGLYSKVQFNLATEKGREAFASVAFFGHEQEWSIGYKTLQATFDPTMQANVLREVELYEVSPVLHGANQLTATLSVKSDEGGEKCGPGGMHGPATMDIPRFNLIPLKPASISSHNEREDIFGEGEAAQLGDEARAALEMELASRSSSPIRVTSATENTVVFDRGMPDGTRITYRLPYHMERHTGKYMFGKPEKMASQQIIPSQMPSMPMMVKPGYVTQSYGNPQQPISMMKSFDEQLDQAIGVLSNAGEDSTVKESELQKIQDAIDYLRNLAGGQQEKTALEYSVWCKPRHAYQVKSLLDPVLEYHRLEAHVDDYGVHITSGLNEESLQAVRSAHKNIAKYLDGGGGSKKDKGASNTKAAPQVRVKALGGKIGPKLGGGLRSAPKGMAFVDITGVTDADSDGIVFEGKEGLERPIIPRFIVPKDLARKLSAVVEGDAEAIERQRRAGNSNVSFDEKKLRGIIDDLGGDPNLLQNLSGDKNRGMRSRSGDEDIEAELDEQADRQFRMNREDSPSKKPKKTVRQLREEARARFDTQAALDDQADMQRDLAREDRGMRSRRGGEEFDVYETPGVSVFNDRQIKITENEDGTFNAFTIENIPGTDGAYALRVGDGAYPNFEAAKRAANREKFGNSRGYGRSGGDGRELDFSEVPGKQVFGDESIRVTENQDGTFNAFTVENVPGSDGGYLRQVGDDVYESLDEAKNAATQRKFSKSRGMRSRRGPWDEDSMWTPEEEDLRDLDRRTGRTPSEDADGEEFDLESYLDEEADRIRDFQREDRGLRSESKRKVYADEVASGRARQALENAGVDPRDLFQRDDESNKDYLDRITPIVEKYAPEIFDGRSLDEFVDDNNVSEVNELINNALSNHDLITEGLDVNVFEDGMGDPSESRLWMNFVDTESEVADNSAGKFLSETGLANYIDVEGEITGRGRDREKDWSWSIDVSKASPEDKKRFVAIAVSDAIMSHEGYWGRDGFVLRDADRGMRSRRGGEDVDTTELVPEANLEGADLSDQDLQKIDLSYANLNGADLNRSTLSGASFQGANLSGVNMAGAEAEESVFYRANLRNADMTGIYGRRADFENSDLRGADLSGADLIRADLRGADLTGANLQGANLTGAYLDGAIFKDANLDGAELDKGWEQSVGMRSRGMRGMLRDEFDFSNRKPDKKLKPAYGRSGPVPALQNMSDDELIKLLESYSEIAPRPWDRNRQSSFLFQDRPSLSSLVQELDSRGYDVYQSQGREAEYFGDYSAGDKGVYARKRGQGSSASGLERMLSEMSGAGGGETRVQDVIDSRLDDRRRGKSKGWKATVPDDYVPSDDALDTLSPQERRLLETFKPKPKWQREQEMLEHFRQQTRRDIDSGKMYDTWDWHPSFEEWDKDYKDRLRKYRSAQRKAYAHDIEKGNVKPEEKPVDEPMGMKDTIDWRLIADDEFIQPLRLGSQTRRYDGFRSAMKDVARRANAAEKNTRPSKEQRALDVLGPISQRGGQAFGLSDAEVQNFFDGGSRLDAGLQKIIKGELRRQGFTNDDIKDLMSGKYSDYVRGRINPPTKRPDLSPEEETWLSELNAITDAAERESLAVLADGLTEDEFADFVRTGKIPNGKESVIRRANEVYDSVSQDKDKQMAMGLRSRSAADIQSAIDANIKKQRDLEKEMDDGKIDLDEFRRRQTPLRQEFAELRKEQGATPSEARGPKLDATGRPAKGMVERDEKGKVKFDSEAFLAEKDRARRARMSELGFSEDEINTLLGRPSQPAGMRSRTSSPTRKYADQQTRENFLKGNNELISNRLGELVTERASVSDEIAQLDKNALEAGRELTDKENSRWDELEGKLSEIDDEIGGIVDFLDYAEQEDIRRIAGKTSNDIARSKFKQMLDDDEISTEDYEKLVDDLIYPGFYDEEYWDSNGGIDAKQGIRSDLGNNSPYNPFEFSQYNSSDEINDAVSGLATELADEKVTDAVRRLRDGGLRSRSGGGKKKKKTSGPSRKLTPEQVRISQEQKLRSKKVPGKKKEGPSKHEWGFRSLNDYGISNNAVVEKLADLFSRDDNDLTDTERSVRNSLIGDGIKIDFSRVGDGDINADISLRNAKDASADEKLDSVIDSITSNEIASDYFNNRGFVVDDRYVDQPSYKREAGLRSRRSGPDSYWDRGGNYWYRTGAGHYKEWDEGYEGEDLATRNRIRRQNRPSNPTKATAPKPDDGDQLIQDASSIEGNDFAASIVKQYKERGRLTQKQWDSLRSVVSRNKKKSPSSSAEKQTENAGDAVRPLSDDDKKAIIDAARKMDSDFARSVVSQYDARGKLSDKQWNALDKSTRKLRNSANNNGGMRSRRSYDDEGGSGGVREGVGESAYNSGSQYIDRLDGDNVKAEVIPAADIYGDDTPGYAVVGEFRTEDGSDYFYGSDEEIFDTVEDAMDFLQNIEDQGNNDVFYTDDNFRSLDRVRSAGQAGRRPLAGLRSRRSYGDAKRIRPAYGRGGSVPALAKYSDEELKELLDKYSERYTYRGREGSLFLPDGFPSLSSLAQELESRGYEVYRGEPSEPQFYGDYASRDRVVFAKKPRGDEPLSDFERSQINHAKWESGEITTQQYVKEQMELNARAHEKIHEYRPFDGINIPPDEYERLMSEWEEGGRKPVPQSKIDELKALYDPYARIYYLPPSEKERLTRKWEEGGRKPVPQSEIDALNERLLNDEVQRLGDGKRVAEFYENERQPRYYSRGMRSAAAVRKEDKLEVGEKFKPGEVVRRRDERGGPVVAPSAPPSGPPNGPNDDYNKKNPFKQKPNFDRAPDNDIKDFNNPRKIADGMRSKAGARLGESREIYPARRGEKSSAVDFVRYDAAREELVVQYKGGGVYTFGGISAEDADTIEQSESLGKALNDAKRNSTYTVKPNGDVSGVQSDTADFLERDMRRVPMTEDDRRLYSSAIKLLRGNIDEDSDLDAISSQVSRMSDLGNEMWENEDYAAANFLWEAAEKINKKVNSARGGGGFRSRASARHQRMEVNLSADEIGEIRDEIRNIMAKHSGNSLITYGLKKYDNLLEEWQGQKKSNPGRPLTVLSSEYDTIMSSYDELEGTDPDWSKTISADPLEMASISKDGKFSSPNIQKEGSSFDGKRINNGAPEDITPRMQGELIDWGRRQPNFRIVQELLKAHEKNNGQMTARQWSTLRNMFDRFAKENRGGNFRSRTGSGMRSEVGITATSTRKPGLGKGPRTAKEALPEDYNSMSLDEKFDALLSVGKYDEQTNPNGIQVGEYNAAYRRLQDLEDEQDRVAARREALAERMKRAAEAGPVTPRPRPGEEGNEVSAPKVQKTPEERAAIAKKQRQKRLSAIENAVAKIQDKISGAVIDGDADDAHRELWDEVMDLILQEDDGDDADLTLSKLGSIIEALDNYVIGFDGQEMQPAERRSINNAVKVKNTLEELYDEIENDPFVPRGSTSREGTTILAGDDDEVSPTPRFMTGEGLRSRSNLVNDYIGARKTAERKPYAGMRSRSATAQEGRAEIRWEATEFNKVEQALSREISEARNSGDRKTASALQNLMKIMDRQKSGDFGGKRTNAGALYLTQAEIDDVMDALMHVVDRQASTGGSRINLFAQMLDKLAEAGMATFIEKTAKEVNSRFVEKTNEAGRTVRIPLNE